MTQDCLGYNLWAFEKDSSTQSKSLMLCGVSFTEVRNELQKFLQRDLDDSNVEQLNDNLIRLGQSFSYEETLNNSLDCSARIDNCLNEMNEVNFPAMWKFGENGNIFFIEGVEF